MRPWQWDTLAGLHIAVGIWVLTTWPAPSWFGVVEVWLGGVCLVASALADLRPAPRPPRES